MSEYHDMETGEALPSSASQSLDARLLHGELLCSPDTTEVWGALIQAQAEMEPPQRTKEASVKGSTKAGKEYEYKYKYAPLEAIIAALRPPFAKHGLGYQQFLARAGNNPVLRTIIFHKSAQWTAVDYPIFWDTSKGQQGFQGGVTYARRGGLSLATGLAPEDDDDSNVLDGQPATISDRAKGVTRAAAPRPTNAAIHPVTSAVDSPGPSSTGNGARPKWITDFLARKSYEIDPEKAGGWSAFEKAYCAIADAADDFDQLMKLDDDNVRQCVEFSRAVKPAVYDRFREHVKVNAKRLAPAPFVDQADAERVFGSGPLPPERFVE
jgi:hypothetical protein